MYANFACLMAIRSTTFGVSPLYSQAFGAGNHYRCGLVLMRILLLHTLMMIFMSLPLTMAAGPLLRAFGQPEAIATKAQTFVYVRLAALPGTILYTDLTAFLNAQRCVRLPMVVGTTTAVLQSILMFPMTRWLGFLGAPIAMTALETFQGMALLCATPWVLRREKLRSWPPWCRERRQAWRGWSEIIAKGSPAAVMILSEWFGWEVTIFIASRLCGTASDGKCPEVEAIPICTSVMVLQFIVAFGHCLSCSIRVGNLLGAGQPQAARFCAAVAWCMASGTQALNAILILTHRDAIAALFVHDESVRTHVYELMPYTTAYSILATMAAGWSQQLLFGLGARLRVPAAINFVSFFGVGIPAGSALAFDAGLAERGLWTGLVIAMALVTLGQYFYIFVFTDWDVASKKARDRALNKDRLPDEHSSSGRSEPTEPHAAGRGLAAADSAVAALEM